jgi:hypothetical protein
VDVHITDQQSDVRLTITIGNLQIGGSTVKWANDNAILAQGPVFDLPLGSGNSVIGKTLNIRTNFFDQNPNSNFVSGMYDFNNGNDPIHVYFDEVQNNGDFFVFNISITFN